LILLSVGTQLPFDRLVRVVDAWADANGRQDVIAQIGPSNYVPKALKSFHFLDHEHFRELQAQCDLMVSHAGMGSIVTALEFGKPIVIMARDHRLGEHRNGHQVATLRRFGDRPGIYPAAGEPELINLLDNNEALTAGPRVDTKAPPAFVQYLRSVAAEDAGRPRAWWRPFSFTLRGRR
jgi:UDP-N-acetylglucosamine transferase subunit ALG13